MLDRHEDRPSPLPAEGEALYEAQEDEQCRRQDAHLPVGRQQADKERGEPHHEERDDEHALAPDLVPVVAEEDPAYGPRREPDAEGSERQQHPYEGVVAREEERPEDQRRRRPVQKEVVPLDRRPDKAGKRDLRDRGALALLFPADLLHEPPIPKTYNLAVIPPANES